MEIEDKPEVEVEKVDEETTVREVYEGLQEQTVSQSIRLCSSHHLPICVTYHDEEEKQCLLFTGKRNGL